MAGVDLELSVAWQQHVGTSPVATSWFDSVVAMYRSPDRHYHDDRHVRWVVRHVLSIADDRPPTDLGSVVAAGFFHDAVYDPTRHDNEAASARLAEHALGEIGWPTERTARVADMVLATAAHDVSLGDAGTHVLLAADLAVLATEPGRYGDYVRAVRREYAHVDEDAWRTGRGAVLHALLDRPRLYAGELGLETWERRARANLTSELATLA